MGRRRGHLDTVYNISDMPSNSRFPSSNFYTPRFTNTTSFDLLGQCSPRLFVSSRLLPRRSEKEPFCPQPRTVRGKRWERGGGFGPGGTLESSAKS